MRRKNFEPAGNSRYNHPLGEIAGKDTMMKIVIGADQAGFKYKEVIKKFLIEKGYTVDDFGTDSEKPCDYPDIIRPVAKAVAAGKYDRGIILGGSGNGEAMVANRVKGVRCALCWDLRSARLSRAHNDANVLSMGERMIAIEEALEIVELWLNTPFDGGRHLTRIQKIDAE
jgi:ribose 5-phosphate isomerase B